MKTEELFVKCLYLYQIHRIMAETTDVDDDGSITPVPDEQLLYENLMDGYEKSVRPVLNASTVLIVKFGLRLNQIVGLDERHQVLTTNVFIDQEWNDENLWWDTTTYSNIKSIRIPAKRVWLPDTFIYNKEFRDLLTAIYKPKTPLFPVLRQGSDWAPESIGICRNLSESTTNSADDGSTGFMQGTYVLVNHNGTVLWPVPVKLKSSCKVDITYFPFDDQKCVLRFGSWIYSGLWMDYVEMHDDRPIDLSSYVNNSEWDLLSVTLKKNIRTHSCCTDPHPDLTYILHIRRKTFYYIFNVIVPCIMLSILTLLTFWLPPTSGEKITLGLSVFLAFSMFMLLIAEEVPATSEAVPLIGIYLCVVMTMTSLSVIMAVMVINIYNRGTKTRRAPYIVRKLVLNWLSVVLCLRHDLDRLVESITLDSEKDKTVNVLRRASTQFKRRESRASSLHPTDHVRSRQNSVRNRNSRNEVSTIETLRPDTTEDRETEVVWLRRDEVHPDHSSEQAHSVFQFEEDSSIPNLFEDDELYTTWRPMRHVENKKESVDDKNKVLHRKKQTIEVNNKQVEPSHSFTQSLKERKEELHFRKLIVAEWQRIAAVIDRVLFWFYFVGTLTSYLVILIIVPRSNYALWNSEVQYIQPDDTESRYTM